MFLLQYDYSLHNKYPASSGYTYSLIIHLRPEQAKQVARFNPLDEFWCYSWGGDGIPTLLHKENGKLNIFVELDKLLESFRNKTLLFTFKNCTCKFLGLSAVNSNSCRLYEYGKAEIYIFPKTCQAVNQQFWLIINLKIYFTKNKTFCCRNLLKRVKEECFFLFVYLPLKFRPLGCGSGECFQNVLFYTWRKGKLWGGRFFYEAIMKWFYSSSCMWPISWNEFYAPYMQLIITLRLNNNFDYFPCKLQCDYYFDHSGLPCLISQV